MWQPQQIYIKNLFSHPETTFQFKQNEMILLLGKNLDKVGSDSNGGGKSTIIESLTLAVTGAVYRDKVTKVDFIRRDQKDCVVIFHLQHSVTQQKFRIERQFFISSSKSSTVKLFEDERELTELTNPNESNKYIFSKLGISKEDFLNYYVIGQGNTNSFFAASDTKQKEVIARFSNYERIDKVLEQLKIEVDELNEELNPLQNNLNSIDIIIEHIENEISNENERFETSKKELLENKNNDVIELKEEISTINAKKETNRNKLNTVNEELKALNKKVKNQDTLKVELTNLKQSLADSKQELKDIDKTIAELNKQSGATVECPKCGEAFIPNSELSPEEVKAMIEEVELLKQSLETTIEEAEITIETKRTQITIQTELASLIRVKNNEIKSYTDILSNYQNQLENKKGKLKNLLIEFQAIKDSKPEKSKNDNKSKLQIQKTSRIETEDQIKIIEDQIVEKQFFQYHFGKAGLKTYLANKSIKAINDVTNYYLDKLETNMQVKISGYKVLKSGEVRDQITTKVTTDGIYDSIFEAYSGGERCRVDACGAVAINFMINNNAENGGLNLLIFDERADLDSTGQSELIKTLAKLEKTCILVLHHVDNLPYKNKVYVEKLNKVSKIVEYEEPKMDITKLLQLQS